MSSKRERLPVADVLGVLAAISAVVKMFLGLWLSWRTRNLSAAVEALQDAVQDADVEAALKHSRRGQEILATIQNETPEVAAAAVKAAGMVKDVRRQLWEAKAILQERLDREAMERYYQKHGHRPGEGHLKIGR